MIATIQNNVTAGKTLIAEPFNSHFELSHDTYNGMAAASDGKIYYVLCSESIDVGAQMYSYDPAANRIKHLGDLTEACGEKGLKAVPQGKSHVQFCEFEGKLYFTTHVAYYNVEGGKELMGVLPPGYSPYPGGHFVAYHMATGEFEELAKGPSGIGIQSMAMDTRRGRLYGTTWPNGHFIRFDLATREVRNLGPTSQEGEAGSGPTFRVLCRSLVNNPEDGSVYFTNSDGQILRYRYDTDAIEVVEGEDLRKDYFGVYDPTIPGHMGYNWRQAFWHDAEKVIYGVHGNSGYLFRFDPAVPQIDVLERLTSEPSRRSGMFDKFYYGYLGLTLGPDGRTLYYLTGGPMIVNGKRVISENTVQVGARGEENLHLITYDIPTGKYEDHGAVFFPDGGRPTWVNAIAVGRDGTVYTLARITEDGKTRTDLVRISAVRLR